MPDQNTEYPTYEQLFSNAAQATQAVSAETMMRLFFSIKVTAYFDFLKRFDPLAPQICAEVMRYSGCAPNSFLIPPETNPNVSLWRMLMIARTFLMSEDNRIPGHFLVYALLIRPFAMYAGSDGCFGYPASDIPEIPLGYPEDFNEIINGEVPF